MPKEREGRILLNSRMYSECDKAEHEDTAYHYSHHGITKCTNFHHSRAIFINKTDEKCSLWDNLCFCAYTEDKFRGFVIFPILFH